MEMTTLKQVKYSEEYQTQKSTYQENLSVIIDIILVIVASCGIYSIECCTQCMLTIVH